jgi:hypothetical protein
MPQRLSSSSVVARRRSRLIGATSKHVGAVGVELEPVGDPLPQHAGRERPEPSRNLILMFICDCIWGLRGSPRMLREPSARGPELHAPGEPSYHAVRRPGCRRSARSAPPGRRDGTWHPPASRKPLICSGVKSGPRYAPRIVSARPGRAGALAVAMPDQLRHAQRAARVARRRLDPELLERPLAEDPTVAHAVERHAAGQAEPDPARSAGGWSGPSAASPPHTPPGPNGPGRGPAAPGWSRGPRGRARTAGRTPRWSW